MNFKTTSLTDGASVKNYILITFLISTINFSLAQMKMSVDPKTSEVKYDIIGTVKNSRGVVSKRGSNETKDTKIGVNFGVKKGDEIKTGKNSFVKIVMIDETIISLGPNSVFDFSSYEFKTKVNRSANYKLKKGKLRMKVPVKIESGKYQISLRTISLGVRGTEFLANRLNREKGSSVEQIALIEGVLALKRENQKTEILQVSDHFKLRVLKDGTKNSKKSKLTKKELKVLLATNTSDDLDKPFLKTITKEELFGASNIPTEIDNFKEVNSEKSKKGKNWRESLKELNNKHQNK